MPRSGICVALSLLLIYLHGLVLKHRDNLALLVVFVIVLWNSIMKLVLQNEFLVEYKK
jgi:hypothetical protein